MIIEFIFRKYIESIANKRKEIQIHLQNIDLINQITIKSNEQIDSLKLELNLFLEFQDMINQDLFSHRLRETEIRTNLKSAFDEDKKVYVINLIHIKKYYHIYNCKLISLIVKLIQFIK